MNMNSISKNIPEFCEFYDFLVSAFFKARRLVYCNPNDLIFTNDELCVIVSALQSSKDIFDKVLQYEKE